MKKIISNEEIVKKAKEWVESFTFDEFGKMLKEEIYFSELYDFNNSEWLQGADITKEVRRDIPSTKYDIPIIKKDRGEVGWTLVSKKNEGIEIPYSIKVKVSEAPRVA